jgi:hypothetical protein
MQGRKRDEEESMRETPIGTAVAAGAGRAGDE